MGGADRQSVVQMSLGELRRSKPHRRCGVNRKHVDALTRLGGNWPPILVHGDSRQVIDGVHRVLAAQELGMSVILCEIFRGSQSDAYVEFLRRNVRNGLPLTLSDRKRGAQRVLCEHSEWSDRRIGDLCALAAATVARMRAGQAAVTDERPTDQFEQLDVRVGRDGRSRPLDRRALRARVLQAEEENPGASLRAVAEKAGASPETVRRIRNGIGWVRGDGLNDSEAGRARPPVGVLGRGSVSGVDPWVADRAFGSMSGSTEFAAWFDKSSIDGGWNEYVDAVPLGRIYEVADECRRRAKSWQELSAALERRARSSARAG
jgi:hypothetical protein